MGCTQVMWLQQYLKHFWICLLMKTRTCAKSKYLVTWEINQPNFRICNLHFSFKIFCKAACNNQVRQKCSCYLDTCVDLLKIHVTKLLTNRVCNLASLQTLKESRYSDSLEKISITVTCLLLLQLSFSNFSFSTYIWCLSCWVVNCLCSMKFTRVSLHKIVSDKSFWSVH